MMSEAMVREWLEKNYGSCRDASGYAMELYADYRDELDLKTAIEILDNDDPEIAFYEELGYMYDTAQCNMEDELIEKCAADLGVEEDDVRDAIYELTYPVYPADHFLKQEFRVPIMVDTGAESNVDFMMNYGWFAEELESFSKLINGFGYYYELGNAWNLSLYKIVD